MRSFSITPPCRLPHSDFGGTVTVTSYKQTFSSHCHHWAIWNYKKVNWEHFSTLTDTYTAKIRHKQQNLNQQVKALSHAILKAATESIPRGARQNYRPDWTEECQQLEDSVSQAQAREGVEGYTTEENNNALKASAGKQRQTFIQGARRSWHEQIEQLNMDKEGNKLWKLARVLNDETSRSSPITLQHN